MLNNTKRTMSNLSTIKSGLDLIRGKKEETRKPSSLFDDIFETRKPAPKKKKSNESSLIFDILSDLTETKDKTERKPSINITIDTRETRKPQSNYYDPFTTNEYSKWNTFEHNARNRHGKIVIICTDSGYGRDYSMIENMMCDAAIKYRDYRYVYCKSYEISSYIDEIKNGGKYESYVFVGFPLNYTAKTEINRAVRKENLTHRELEKYINWISYDRIYDSESWIKWYHSDDYRSSWTNNSVCATLSYLADTEILSNYEKEYLFRKYAERTINW